MTGFTWCLMVGMLGAPQVVATTLDGEERGGELVGLSSETLTLKKDNAELRVPVAEVLELRFSPGNAPQPDRPVPPVANLTDGSRFAFTSVSATAREITFDTPRLGKFALPLLSAASLRFAPADPKVDDAWNELCGREIKKDLLVIRKEDILDHLDGTVGVIEGATIHFVVDGEDVPVKREKIFGIIYAGRSTGSVKAACEMTTSGADLLKLRDVAWSEGKFQGKLATGASVAVATENVRALDFSLGKVRYLSQMEPRDVKYTPYFDTVWNYQRDRNRDGEQLRLANKTYSRGLWIHSRTLLRYRLAGDYRRFRATMGIDQGVAPRGDVHVVIQGDGKTILEADVKGSDAPRLLDLDVSGVRDLEILVDFGGDLDISDHLDLCDAKVIK